MTAVGNGVQCLRDLAVVVQRLLKCGAATDKFLKVAASSKRFVTGAADDDAAHAGVVINLTHVSGNLLPHREIDGVELVRVVQCQGGDFAVQRQIDGAHFSF